GGGALMEPTMITIPAGEFVLGVTPVPDDFALHHRWPTRRVRVEAFEMSRTAVTNAQYRAFLEDTGDPAMANPWMDKPGYDDDDQPVVNICWLDAKAYCDWLARKTGKPFRLPTDAEWEYAARGGADDTAAFPWGDELDASRAWFG